MISEPPVVRNDHVYTKMTDNILNVTGFLPCDQVSVDVAAFADERPSPAGGLPPGQLDDGGRLPLGVRRKYGRLRVCASIAPPVCRDSGHA
jgi:hypothetical protein